MRGDVRGAPRGPHRGLEAGGAAGRRGHRSRLAGFILDCRADDLDAAARFWASALGTPLLLPPSTKGYLRLGDGPRDLHVAVQQVSHESRVHVDLETDDIAAEVARLERPGATRVEKGKRWWVMQAATGQGFCVVQAREAGSRDGLRTWE